MAVIKFLALVYRKWNKPIQVDDKVKEIFTDAWNNIAHPKDSDDRIKNVCILFVSTLIKISMREMEKLCSDYIKPLFETVMGETKILDNESKLLWLESLKNLLLILKSDMYNFYKNVIENYDLVDGNYQNKSWWFLIEMREFFDLKFLKYMNFKYFNDHYISLNESFDCLLLLIVLLIKNRNDE